MLNFKNSIFFIGYLQTENSTLREMAVKLKPDRLHIKGTSSSNISLSVSRTFSTSESFNFIRFYHLLYFISPYSKAQSFFFKRNSTLLLKQTLRGILIVQMLSKLYNLQFGSKATFMRIDYTYSSGFVKIVEPHVVFLASSPYFDYHTSHLSLTYCFKYSKDDPTINYIFNYFF